MNTAVRKRFFTRFVAAALLVTGATGAGTLAPSALAARVGGIYQSWADYVHG